MFKVRQLRLRYAGFLGEVFRLRHDRPSRRARLCGLVLLVAAWWLLLAAVVASVVPAPAASAPKPGAPLSPGQQARIAPHVPRQWTMPVDRGAFDAFERGFRESDEQAIERAEAATAWIAVPPGLAIEVVSVEDGVAQIAVREGEQAGRRGWVRTRYISP